MHTRFLQLFEGTASFNTLMLAGIADQQYTVLRGDAGEKLAHLVSAGETRFIYKVKVLLFRGSRC